MAVIRQSCACKRTECVLSGKAQKAFSSFPQEASLDFDKVKAAVLSAYKLVPEAYRQDFVG